MGALERDVFEGAAAVALLCSGFAAALAGIVLNAAGAYHLPLLAPQYAGHSIALAASFFAAQQLAITLLSLLFFLPTPQELRCALLAA